MECKECKQKSMMAGQAFRNYRCGHCFETRSWPNTATPKICGSCSKLHGRCERCL